jgi:transcriptional regulator with XRE-family HTH domain
MGERIHYTSSKFTMAKTKFSSGESKRFPTVVVRGEVLSSWLTVSDYKKSQLALKLHVSKGRVSQLLTSQEEPSAHLIAKLMSVTHLSFDRLFKIVHVDPRSSAERTSHNKNGSSENDKIAQPDQQAVDGGLVAKVA